MRVSRLVIRDFCSIGEADIDFDALPSLVMIAGKVRSAGASSNGAGKCFARGTKILMADGRRRAVEEVRVGDLLMGPDSRPRRVLSLSQGVGPLYRVTPTKGAAYTVNENHVLSLKMCGTVRRHGVSAGTIVNMPVREWLSFSPKTLRRLLMGWRTGVDWPTAANQPVPPHLLGCWLGDGTSGDPEITTPDREVVFAMRAYAASHGLRVVRRNKGNQGKASTWAFRKDGPGVGYRGTENLFSSSLRALGVWNAKHIPRSYLVADREQRLQLLAGIIDSDGCLSNGGYDFISISRRLSYQVAFLTRSLGLAAYVRRCRKCCTNSSRGRVWGTYWRVSISGDCSVIPCRVPRRKAPARKQVKNVLLTSIRVDPVGDGEFFGFEVDGDHLFLLGDFTVTHNSSVLDALVWGLFGEEIESRKRPKERVIRRGAKSCAVKVVVQLDNGKRLRVERSRNRSGAVDVLVNGKTMGKPSGAQVVINRRLGFDYDLFTRTVVFGGEFSSFCRMSPADRTRLLEELLGIKYYLDASEHARESLREMDDRLQRLRGLKAAMVEQRASSLKDLDELWERAGDASYAHNSEYARLLHESSRLLILIEAQSDWIGRALRKSSERSVAYVTAMRDWQTSLTQAEDAVTAAAKVCDGKQASLATCTAELKVARKALQDAVEADQEKVCPTCQRPFDARKAPTDFKPYRERAAELAAMEEKRSAAMDAATGVLRQAEAKVTEARRSTPKPPDEAIGLDKAKQRLHTAEGEWSAISRQINSLLIKDDVTPVIERAFQTFRDLQSLREQGDKDRDRRVALKRKCEAMRFWQHGLGRDGIPSMLLEATAPALNKSVRKLAAILTDSAYDVSFKTVVNGARTDFRVEVSNNEGGATYEDLSKGELVRVDLCVLFAIRQLMLDRAAVKCDQVFLDELQDGLDEEGMEHFARLLRVQKIAKQAVYISHSDAFKECADAVITVVKRGGVARVKI